MTRRAAIAAALVALLSPVEAAAQDAALEDGSLVGWTYAVDPIFVPSPEMFTLELRVGTYRPDLGRAFSDSFGGDLGPMLGVELDLHVFRIPYLGPLAVGASFGWAEWSGPARAATPGGPNVGDTGLSSIQLNVLAVLRVDGLARYLAVPLIVSGKIGPDVGFWQTGAGGVTQADGWSVGLRWAAQIALELDFLELRAARRLDDEWGINHTEVFFEFFGSTMGQWATDQLPIGTGLAWTAGLGLTF
jgi:hypothetical protein